jgi:hypothetical protein
MSSADIVSSGSATSAGGGSIFADSATSGSASLSDLREFLPDFLSVPSGGFLVLPPGGLAFALRFGDNLPSGDFDFARDEVRADGSTSELDLAVDCLFEDFVLALPMP